MKRTFIVVAFVVGIVWGGTELWLSGYQQGFTEGEDSAWSRANRKLIESPMGEMEPFSAFSQDHSEQLLVENSDK